MDKVAAEVAAMAAALRAARDRTLGGASIRAWRDASDFEGMAAARNAAAVADGEDLVLDPARLASDLRVYGFDPATHLLLADAGDAVVGWVRFGERGIAPDVGRAMIHTGCVAPDCRRRGIGGALLAGAQAALRELVLRDPVDLPVSPVLESFVQSTAEGTLALLRADGYEVARWIVDMVRPGFDDLPSEVLPDGVECRPVRLEDTMAILRAMNEAAADHPGWASMDDERLRESLDHPTLGQLDVWQVAWAGDEVVGGVLGWIDEAENAARHRRRGYTESIFTRRPWRRQGVASALVGRNLRLLRERGMAEAALSVDTDHPADALRLYRRLGFVADKRLYLMRRPM